MPDIEIAVRGSYTVEDGMVTVVYRGRKKSTQVGGSPRDSIARMVLRELVDDPEGLGTSSA
jgi:hypothetical protein